MPARIGRPRSESARRAVLTAVRDLVAEQGYESVSMVEVAARAGVGRQTIYRWWPSKQAVVADCVLEFVLPFEPIVAVASGDLESDLHAWIRASLDALADPHDAALFRALLAAAATDEAASRAMTSRFVGPLREAVSAAFAASGRASGADLAADLMIGLLITLIVTRGDAAARERVLGAVDLVVR